MKLIDISRSIYTGMPVWPGDTPAEFVFVATKAGGFSCNVGRARLSMHGGTHADAPYHFDDEGAKIDEVPLETYVGPAVVVDVRGHAIIDPACFAGIELGDTPRVLLRSDVWQDPTEFPSEWPVLAPQLAPWFAAQGVKLIGLDFPSVDQRDSKDLPVHHALGRAGVLILENLDLRSAEPGRYELMALPLRIRGGDGSPIRAVLRTCD
ncbi:MAG: cyclase family protein [Candidatus Didemnitutus sp.]|nr:cyclase family protein [Candidatus Didemnitutus sp.]